MDFKIIVVLIVLGYSCISAHVESELKDATNSDTRVLVLDKDISESVIDAVTDLDTAAGHHHGHHHGSHHG